MENKIFWATQELGIVNEPTKNKGYGNPPRNDIVVNRDKDGNIISVGVACKWNEKLFEINDMTVYEMHRIIMNKIYILGCHNGEECKSIFASHDKNVLENKITELEKLDKSELNKLLMYFEGFYIEEVELI